MNETTRAAVHQPLIGLKHKLQHYHSKNLDRPLKITSTRLTEKRLEINKRSNQ